MKLSLRQYLVRKLRHKKQSLVIGISLGRESVSCCVLSHKDGTTTWLKDAEFGHQNWASELADFVKLNKLLGATCYVNLSSHYYQVLQLDRPPVPDDEIYDALSFPIQEFLGTQEPLCYDYTEQVVQVSGQNKLAVIAIPDTEIGMISLAIFDAQLNLINIGVEEISSLELTPMQEEPVLTLVQERGEEIVLNIVRSQDLYFTRRIKGFENLGGYSKEELDMGLVDNLCVQLQRSMDFFESQLRQAPVRKVLIKLDTILQKHIAQEIAKTMDIEVLLFEPDLSLGEGLNLKMASYSCLGAAYQHYSYVSDKTEQNQANERAL